MSHPVCIQSTTVFDVDVKVIKGKKHTFKYPLFQAHLEYDIIIIIIIIINSLCIDGYKNLNTNREFTAYIYLIPPSSFKRSYNTIAITTRLCLAYLYKKTYREH
jgi:hypothetical protein